MRSKRRHYRAQRSFYRVAGKKNRKQLRGLVYLGLGERRSPEFQNDKKKKKRGVKGADGKKKEREGDGEVEVRYREGQGRKQRSVFPHIGEGTWWAPVEGKGEVRGGGEVGNRAGSENRGTLMRTTNLNCQKDIRPPDLTPR